MKRLVAVLFLVLLFAAVAGVAFYGSRIRHEERFFPKTYLESLFPVYHVTDDPTPVEVYLAGRKFAFPRNMIIRMPDAETALNPKSYNSLFLRVVLPDFEGLNAKTKDCYFQKPKECIDVVKVLIRGGVPKFYTADHVYNMEINKSKSWKKGQAKKNGYGLTVYQSVGDGTDWLHVGYMPDGEIIMWQCFQWLPKIQPDEYSLCKNLTGFIDGQIEFSYQVFYKHLPRWREIHAGIRNMILSYEQPVSETNDSREGWP